MSLVGKWLRRIADRIDPDHAPRAMGWGFVFTGKGPHGFQWVRASDGCPVWYFTQDYDRAFVGGTDE